MAGKENFIYRRRMTFIPADISNATIQTLKSVRDRLLEELRSVEAGETRLPKAELAYLRTKLSGLENLIETYEANAAMKNPVDDPAPR